MSPTSARRSGSGAAGGLEAAARRERKDEPMAAVATVAGPPEQRIILHDVGWESYERLLTDFADRRVPRFAYDRRVLEIASPTPKHEKDNLALAQVVESVCDRGGRVPLLAR